MRKLPGDKKFWSIFWAVAAVLCMIIIFFMSHQPAKESAQISGIITEWLMKLGFEEHNAGNIETIVRKSAHMLEYFGLSLCLGMHVLARKGNLNFKSALATIIFCVLYAISDEVHQLFIEGRAGQIRDVFIDSAGAAIAVSGIVIINKLRGRA